MDLRLSEGLGRIPRPLHNCERIFNAAPVFQRPALGQEGIAIRFNPGPVAEHLIDGEDDLLRKEVDVSASGSENVRVANGFGAPMKQQVRQCSFHHERGDFRDCD